MTGLPLKIYHSQIVLPEVHKLAAFLTKLWLYLFGYISQSANLIPHVCCFWLRQMARLGFFQRPGFEPTSRQQSCTNQGPFEGRSTDWATALRPDCIFMLFFPFCRYASTFHLHWIKVALKVLKLSPELRRVQIWPLLSLYPVSRKNFKPHLVVGWRQTLESGVKKKFVERPQGRQDHQDR